MKKKAGLINLSKQELKRNEMKDSLAGKPPRDSCYCEAICQSSCYLGYDYLTSYERDMLGNVTAIYEPDYLIYDGGA